MGIKIDRISVKNLGPIRDFAEKFGLFNLIYSKNERGKTFLTEFIIRSLFRNANIKRWNFREGGSGTVLVSGLKGKEGEKAEPVEFSPGLRNKLEDYWEKEETGLPASMVKLLISKGGEASIDSGQEGIDKSLIKEIFSGISLLDKIDSDGNIPRTVKSAHLQNGSFVISNIGEGKSHKELKEEISQIDRLFDEIESKYNRGILESYKEIQESLKNRLEELQRVKCHEAYKTANKIKELSEKLKKIPDEKINEISTDIALYENKKNDFRIKSGKLAQEMEASKHFEWLQKALPVYEKLTSGSVKKPNTLIAVLSAIFGAVMAVSIVLLMPVGVVVSRTGEVISTAAALALPVTAAVLFIASLVLIIIYISRLHRYSRYAGSAEELISIKKEFNNRIGVELVDVIILSTELDEKRESYERAKFLKSQLDELGNDVEKNLFSIQQKFISLAGKQVQEKDWHAFLTEMITRNKNIKDERENLQLKLIELKVNEAEYIQQLEGSGEVFSCEEFEDVNAAFERISEKISEKEQDITNLKYAVCTETKDDLSIDWEQLFENLKKKRLQKQTELDTLEARIAAGIIVHGVVSQLKQEEDFKILQGLQSELVLKPLTELTGHYNKLSLEGDRLIVSDDYGSYSMQDLSTGAREQIMLALRIGFSSRLLKKDTLFLILDDAFQHSDWDRREILVSQLASIAKTGWQIIYLTMDDHIRDLFNEAGKDFKSGQYKSFNLSRKNYS